MTTTTIYSRQYHDRIPPPSVAKRGKVVAGTTGCMWCSRSEQGLNNIEVKLLGGLEVLVLLENEETVNNVLKDTEHGLRRWLHKLRRGDSLQRTSGRMTWINIIVLLRCMVATWTLSALFSIALVWHSNAMTWGKLVRQASNMSDIIDDNSMNSTSWLTTSMLFW
ncbi:hypothetical protein Tco_0926472 [Tanacetum coccineum]|uniref:Uncharacterized protein n=1 Tax=Tanacetum coccineum TaxID=301880 RepID=A0ABQ5DAQ1_9ASTR